MTVEIAKPIAKPFASMFAKAEEVGPPKSIMLYGEPGTFKTTIAASIIKTPGFNKVLIIDVDNGTEVLANDPETFAAVQDGRIEIFPIDFLDEAAYGKLEYIINEVTTTDYGYDAVILDTLDVSQEVVIRHMMNTVKNDKGQPDTRGAWGEVSKKISQWMWAFQNTKNFTGIVTMHSKDSAEDSGAFKIKPKLAGSIKDNIAGIPSLVAYLEFKEDKETKEGHLVATVGQSTVTSTKNRYMLPKEIIDFDMPLLYATIEEKRKATHALIATNKTHKTTTNPAAVAA